MTLYIHVPLCASVCHVQPACLKVPGVILWQVCFGTALALQGRAALVGRIQTGQRLDLWLACITARPGLQTFARTRLPAIGRGPRSSRLQPQHVTTKNFGPRNILMQLSLFSLSRPRRLGGSCILASPCEGQCGVLAGRCDNRAQSASLQLRAPRGMHRLHLHVPHPFLSLNCFCFHHFPALLRRR